MPLPTTHYPAHGTVESDRIGPYSHGSRIGLRHVSAVHKCHQLCPAHCPKGKGQAEAKIERASERGWTPTKNPKIKIPFEEHDVENQTVQPPDQQDDPFGLAEMVTCTPQKDSEKEKGKSCWESDSEKSMNLDSPSESVMAEQQELLWHHAEAHRPRTPPLAQPRANLAQERPRPQAGPSHLPAPAPKPCPGKLDTIAALQAKLHRLEINMEQKNLLLVEMIQGNGCPFADPKACPCETRVGNWPEWPDASEFMQG